MGRDWRDHRPVEASQIWAWQHDCLAGVEEVGRLRTAERLDWSKASTASRGSATVQRPPAAPSGL